MANWIFGRIDIPLKVLPSGHQLTAPVFRLQGGNSHRKCYIQANNHGGEIAGNGAIFELLRKLKAYDIDGTIIIVPHCNPVSLNAQIDDAQIGVYDAMTGQNWNRLFQLPVNRFPSEWQLNLTSFAEQHRESAWESIKTDFRNEIGNALQRLARQTSQRGIDYAVHFALQLQRLSFDADFVLDLHTGDIAPRYLYSPEYCVASGRYFDIPHILEMQCEFAGAFDEVNFCPWMMLQEEMQRFGRTDIRIDVEAFTVELGSLETVKPAEMDRDAERILNYLKHKRIVAGEARLPEVEHYSCRIQDYLLYYAPASGLAVIDVPPGAKIHVQEEIGYILTMGNLQNPDRLDEVRTPIRVLEDGILITRRKSPIVYKGQPLFKVMTNYRVLNSPPEAGGTN